MILKIKSLPEGPATSLALLLCACPWASATSPDELMGLLAAWTSFTHHHPFRNIKHRLSASPVQARGQQVLSCPSGTLLRGTQGHCQQRDSCRLPLREQIILALTFVPASLQCNAQLTDFSPSASLWSPEMAEMVSITDLKKKRSLAL